MYFLVFRLWNPVLILLVRLVNILCRLFPHHKTELVLTRSDLNNLIASLGEKSVTIGGVRFESRGQIISWVRSNIPSEAYDIFYDVVAH